MKQLVTAIMCLLIVLSSAVTYATGLGDTFADIEKTWNKGYKKVGPPIGSSRIVAIGISKASCIRYTTGLEGYTFGNPERAGRLEGDARGLFGANAGSNPTKQQFIKSIKELMPKDYKLLAAYSTDTPWRKEIYSFSSASFRRLPGIKDSFAYASDGMKHPVGSFMLIVNYDIDSKDRVMNFHLILGLPGEADLSGLKKIAKNSFK